MSMSSDSMKRRLVEVLQRHLLQPPSSLFILLLLKNYASVQSFQSPSLAPVKIIPTTTSFRHQGRPIHFFPLHSSTTIGDDGDNSAKDETAYDITLNLFPEERRIRRESSFADGERSEMNDRPPPPASSPHGSAAAAATTTTTAAAAFASTSTDTAKRKMTTKEDRASALYQKIMSRRKTQAKSTNIKGGDDEAYYDITQSSFPGREQSRQSSSFKQGEKSEMNNRSPQWRKTPPRTDREETRLDITSIFPNNRPSLLVNTGTKKEWTTSGSYSESKTQGSNEENDNTSPTPVVRNNVEEDGASFDITQQHFGTDRATFSLHVNSGMMERRGTHSGQIMPRSYVEGYRNVAQNFSSNRASLLGHPPPRRVVRGEVGGEDGVYLDRHQFSSNVSPASVNTPSSSSSSSSTTTTTTAAAAASKSASKIATNAMWRKGDPISSPSFSSPKKNEEICLDTPRAFVKNLDMIASTKRVPTEADKYLDTNAFSWNIDSTKRKLPVGSTQQQQPYLDKPRPFQSNVDMVSSNFSGAKFKRSSDIPPELKNVKDYYYDITTTAPMPMAEDNMAKMGEGPSRDRGNRWMENDDPIDITRSRFSTLERTSSVIRDGNKAASRAWTNDDSFSVSDVKGTASNEFSSEQQLDDGEYASEQSSSFEGVMYWLLTHLPNLKEEDAVSYFHHLLEDGFDTVDILKELLEEDLYFMKKGHRRAMMRCLSISGSSEADVSREDEDEANGSTIVNDGGKSVHGMNQIRDRTESSETKSDISNESSPEVEAMEEDDTVAALDRAPVQEEKEEASTEDITEGI